MLGSKTPPCTAQFLYSFHYVPHLFKHSSLSFPHMPATHTMTVRIKRRGRCRPMNPMLKSSGTLTLASC